MEIILQDDFREIMLAEMLDLTRTAGRTGSDAVDELGIEYELKTTFQVNHAKGISTTRGVHLHTIERWRKLHWVIAIGALNDNNHYSIDTVHYLSPNSMEMWYQSIEEKIISNIKIWEEMKNYISPNAPKHLFSKLDTIYFNGSCLNNPKIPPAYIYDNGIKLIEPYAESLRQVREQTEVRPIQRSLTILDALQE